MLDDETYSSELSIDFRTGWPTAIDSGFSIGQQRTACTSLNRQRAQGISELFEITPPGEQISPDVWAANVDRSARDWEVPLVPLNSLGLTHDTEGLGLIDSQFLRALTSGAEAQPYLDTEHKVVYKLFNLRKSGGLGKRISLRKNVERDDEINIEVSDSTLTDTIEKLTILNEAGAHPTEIIGLDEDGCFLIAKQSLAFSFHHLDEDRSAAVDSMKGVPAKCRGFNTQAFIVWVQRRPWLIADLHKGNVMRDKSGTPTIIDALHCAISPRFEKYSQLLSESIAQAKALRLGKLYSPTAPFETSRDEDL